MRTLARLNLVVAANVTALALSTQIWWSGYVPVPSLFVLIFFGVVLVYVLLRSRWLFHEAGESDGVMAVFVYGNRVFIGILLLLLLLLVIYLVVWEVPPKYLGFFLPVILSALLYHAPLGKGRKIRQSGAIKLLLISFSVTWITWALPTLSSFSLPVREATDWPLGLLARMFFILGITIPFDVRDLEEDRRKKVKTLAVMTGERPALWIAAFCCIASLILEFLRWNSGGISSLNFLAVSATLTASTFVILEAGKQKGELYYSWLVECMPGLMAFLLWSIRLQGFS